MERGIEQEEKKAGKLTIEKKNINCRKEERGKRGRDGNSKNRR